MPSDTRQFDQRSGGGSGTWGDVTRRMVMDVSSFRYSGLAPEALTTGTHLSISAWTKRVNSAGVMVLDFGADLLPALDHGRLLQHGLHLGRQPVDDRLRRLGRHRDAEPGIGDQVGIAQLLHGRHVGEGGIALLAADGERAHLAGLDVRGGRRQRIEHRRHVAGDGVDHGRTGAAIGHMDHRRADHLLAAARPADGCSSPRPRSRRRACRARPWRSRCTP